MEIWFLIDRLEAMIKKGRRLPLAPGVMVDPGEGLEIIRQMRASLPRDLREARRILEEGEASSSSSGEGRSHPVAQEILKNKQEERDRILEEAKQEAEEMRRGADEYVLEVLGQLEDQLAAVQSTIRNGLEFLQRRNQERKG